MSRDNGRTDCRGGDGTTLDELADNRRDSGCIGAEMGPNGYIRDAKASIPK